MKATIVLAVLIGLTGSTLISYADKAELERVAFDVPKLVCADCPKKVQAALGRASGVTRVESSYVNRRTLVEYDRRKIDVQAIAGTLKEAGFESALVLAIGQIAGRRPLPELEKAMLAVKGVESVRTNPEKKQILVGFAKAGNVTLADLLKAAEKARFDDLTPVRLLDDPKERPQPRGGCCGF
ncbi:MAG: cation transporter [Armatimonadetes bacterium]|nr:cation transporter [Armatimonadota bacterium]